MPAPRYMVGLDDTDFGSSIGTGALARELMLHLQLRLAAEPLGITRHQLLVDRRIPYTSHNSSACVGLRTTAARDQLLQACRGFIELLPHPGADPGLCVACQEEAPSAAVLRWGTRAQREVLRQEEAHRIADVARLPLLELGGTGGGVIGALAACGLRLSGEDGRFIDLGPLRQLDGRIGVGELVRQCPLVAVVDPDGGPVPDSAQLETHGWVRPELRGGRAVQIVHPGPQPGQFEIRRQRTSLRQRRAP